MNIKDIIPDDWKLVNLSEITELITKGTTPTTNGYSYLDDGVNFVKVESIHANGTFIPKMFAHVGEDCHNSFKRSQLRNNDILFTIAGALGRSAIVNYEILPANTNQAVAIIRLKNAEYLNYIFHYLRGNYVKNLIDKINVSTAQANLSLGQINQFEIPLPPLPEQQKIAEILSTVDDKIEVIDQQIIETQELKKGLMQRLLTKGIGHTEFKDSPLGEIPKSWVVVKLGEITEQLKDGTHGTHKEVEGGIPLLSAKDIRNGRIYIPDDCRKLSQADFNSIHKNFKLKDGDVLLTVVGSIGRVAVINNYSNNYTFQRSVGYIRLNNHHDSYFFKHYFQSDIFVKQLLLRSNASAQAGVYLGELGKILIISFPIEEQKKIAEILSSLDDKLEVLSEKKSHYQELKKGLMQQLLTGKIRVKV